MSAVLLDANVLIALIVEEHVHHGHAEAWFITSGTGFATCPITQGNLMRLLIREGQTADSARSVLQEIAASRSHSARLARVRPGARQAPPRRRRPDTDRLTSLNNASCLTTRLVAG